MKQNLMIIAITIAHISGLALLIASNASSEPVINNHIDLKVFKAAGYVSPVSTTSSAVTTVNTKNNEKDNVCQRSCQRTALKDFSIRGESIAKRYHY